MKNIFKLFIFSLLIIAGRVRADEGMWLPIFVDRLNYTDMQRTGLRLTAEEIYSVNHSSLKDAIIIFGRGCTGEVVSGEGLVFTNHHCGYGAIQSLSSVQNDYLTNGFWAMRKEEELPVEGLTATFVVKIEDVTRKVLSSLDNNMSETEREKKLQEMFKQLEDEAVKGTHYTASVRRFYHGNEFYLFVFEVFKDVRLVGTPPNAIGKFGGDTDNWMWPRHTGDFSVFRIYSGPDGKPASYSKENTPYKPKKFLEISLRGVKKNDYAMIMGFPGSTNRYLTSWGVKLAIEETNPSIVAIRDKRLSVMREDMNASDAVRIKYASKYAGIANYWKYFIGQTRGLKRLDVYEKKKEIENRFTEWVNASDEHREKYGSALKDISSAYAEIGKFAKTRIYYTEGLLRGCEVIGFARYFEDLYDALKADNPDKTLIDKELKRISERVADFFKNYNAPTDQKLMAAVFEMFSKNVSPEYYPEYFKEIVKESRGDYLDHAEDIFEESIFTDQARLQAFLLRPKAKILAKDPVFRCMQSFNATFGEMNGRLNEANALLGKGNRLFVAGLREMMTDRKFYPDANSTLRLTYGKVLDYYPADAVHYDYMTTLEGIMEKEDPKNDEFIVPARLKELFRAKDYGPYGENGKLVTCFLTNTDITGGNSGSPVLNADGQLTGLAFDGNWEAMSGDIAFEPELQRTIAVDIRYVLFIIDKYAGAKNIIAELSVIH